MRVSRVLLDDSRVLLGDSVAILAQAVWGLVLPLGGSFPVRAQVAVRSLVPSAFPPPPFLGTAIWISLFCRFVCAEAQGIQSTTTTLDHLLLLGK